MARPYRKSLTSIAELVDEPGRIGRVFCRSGAALQIAFAGLAGFAVCLGASALREPVLVAPLSGQLTVPGVPAVELRGACQMAQALGLVLSQPIGAIAVVELDPSRRVGALATVLALGAAALVALGMLPLAMAPACLFVNGLALGLVWGLVFSFLEGRRVSDALGALAAAGYLLAGGVTRGLGDALALAGVPGLWVPAAVGGVVALPLAGSLWMLAQLPPPSRQDEAERFFRAPMTGAMRWQFLRVSALGIGLLAALHALLGAYRELRTSLTLELWGTMADPEAPTLLTVAELPAVLAAILAVGGLMFVRDHRRALIAIHGLILLGLLLMGGSTGLHLRGWIDVTSWMILVGAGAFLVHVPFMCVLFDRMVSAVGLVGSAVFLIFVVGACGHLGRLAVVGLELWRGPLVTSHGGFAAVSLGVVAVGAILLVASAIYFNVHRRDALSVTGGI